MTCFGSHKPPGSNLKSGFRVHSPKHYVSCFSMFLRFAIRDEHSLTKALRGVLTSPWACSPLEPHLYPPLIVSFIPWLAFHLHQDSVSQIQPNATITVNQFEKQNEFLNQILNLISNFSVTKLHNHTY